MPAWSFKRDAAGRPRRFLSHREAALWSLRAGVVVGGVFAAPMAFEYLLYLILPPVERPFGFFVVMIPVLIFFTVSVPVYLYIALSGGVMDRDARRRHLDGERPSPRR